MSVYTGLNRAQLSYEYLHTNSTTHEFIFGALAELVDNSRDAKATKINIYTVPDKTLMGGFMLCFQDDGEGMSPEETANMITFGKSNKRGLDSNFIGQYGNGFKSGSMRLGRDVILFTKKESTLTCLMLSRTFHESENIQEVIVPIPSFSSQNFEPLLAKYSRVRDRHEVEMALVLKYSPFHTREEFFSQFKLLAGDSGTLVIIYNLKLLDSGKSELDIITDPHDILISDIDFEDNKRLYLERKSFRAYASVLYLEPRMKIYIQNKKVRPVRFEYSLFRPRCYQHTSARFKARSKNMAKEAEEKAKIAIAKAKDAESKARQLELELENSTTGREARTRLRQTQKLAADLQEEAQYLKQIADKRKKELKAPKTIHFMFGINIENRSHDGIFVYNCSRLIKMYERVSPQQELGSFCKGVVGVVNIPYVVLEPTHNKQDFADSKEYRHLLKFLGQYMEQYWADVNINQQGIDKFWESYGYKFDNWEDLPSQDLKFARKRAMQTRICLQCDICLKWRHLPYSASNVGKDFPDDWVCSKNPDSTHNRCSIPEEKPNIPEGKVQKLMKSQGDKEETIQEEMKKLQTKLEKVKKLEKVETSSSIKKAMEKVAAKQKQNQNIYKRRISSASDDFSTKKARRDSEALSQEDGGSSSAGSEEIDSDDIGSSFQDSHSKKNRDTFGNSSPKRTRKDSGTRSQDERSDNDDKNSNDQKNLEWDSWPDSGDDEQEVMKNYEIGTKVEVKVKGKWYKASVIKLKTLSNSVQVKFDKYPEDKYNKTIAVDSSDMKILQYSGHTEAQSSSVPCDSVGSRDGGCSEIPSSSLSSDNSHSSVELFENIAKCFRTCIHYFLPPQWIIDKDMVNSLTLQELSEFPLDDFFDHYEKGLRKLVFSFQNEASTYKEDARKAQISLQCTKKLIARLLNSIHEECNLDIDRDLDKVDELLEACVKQAEMVNNKISVSSGVDS